MLQVRDRSGGRDNKKKAGSIVFRDHLLNQISTAPHVNGTTEFPIVACTTDWWEWQLKKPGYKNYKYKWCSVCVCVMCGRICIRVCVRVHKHVCMRMCNVICHPSPSNSQHEHTICMNYYTLVAWLLLTPDHYQQWITVYWLRVVELSIET